MPIVVSNRQRIYFRYEGERGAFLMLHHGLFGSHQDWYRAGYVEELAKEFRLVIPDARGHGRSDRPAEPGAYRATDFAEDLVEIINGLGIRNLHFLGYGMGAQIGLEMLRRFPERVRIAVLGGEAPLTLPAVREHWQALAAQLGGGTLAQLVADLRARDRLVRWEQTDPPEEERPAALALLEALGGWELHGEERISVTSPVTLFAGANDPAAERVERARSFINRARLVLFPGLNHASLFAERTQVTQELVRLLKSGRREEGDSPHRRHGGEGAEGGTPGEGRHAGAEERRSGRSDDRPPERREERRRAFRSDGGRRNGSQRRDFHSRPDRPEGQGQPGAGAAAAEPARPVSSAPAAPPTSTGGTPAPAEPPAALPAATPESRPESTPSVAELAGRPGESGGRAVPEAPADAGGAVSGAAPPPRLDPQAAGAVAPPPKPNSE
jgi:pimeloyl-ACP methyl ester carboxylesterase